MRFPALILLTLTFLHPAVAAAQATLNKCIDTQGNVTYSNLPCRNAREAHKVEIDPTPKPDPVQIAPVRTQPDKPVLPKPATTPDPVSIRLETQHTAGGKNTAGKSDVRASARQCDTFTDKLGRVFDKMDQARRKGYTQQQMDKWNQEIKDLEQKKQQSGCF